MAKFEKTIVIDAPPEKVFARISDPMNMMEDIPNAVDCTDITGEGVGKSFKTVYKMAGIKLSMACTYTEYVEDKKIASTFDGGLKGTTSFVLEPENGGTKLTVTCEYAVPIPLIGKIAESLLAKRNEREWDVVLANIKDAIEAGS
ncbi:MAG: SRPBCC family protein [Phycisphaerae bacterium]|nr:SRPBCC family protein [Phycisphaerae bacterium]